MNDSSELDPIVFRYTRAMAIADGVLIDANRGGLGRSNPPALSRSALGND